MLNEFCALCWNLCISENYVYMKTEKTLDWIGNHSNFHKTAVAFLEITRPSIKYTQFQNTMYYSVKISEVLIAIFYKGQ